MSNHAHIAHPFRLAKNPVKCDQCIKEHRHEILFYEERVAFHWCPHQRMCGAFFYGQTDSNESVAPAYELRENFSATMADQWIKDIIGSLREMQSYDFKR